MKQEQFPEFEFVPLRKNDEPDFRWYYITKDRNEKMLLSFDFDGKPIWTEHDLQYKIPNVFSTAQEARRVMKKIGGHDVKMSRYKVINGNRVIR